MNPYEYAMNMEKEGRDFYLEQAGQMTDPTLKKIYEELAADEQRHYAIFKALLDGEKADLKAAFKTDILKTTKNVFQQLKDSNSEILEYPKSVRDAWVKARDIEDNAEEFYRNQAEKTKDKDEKETWLMIAEEERKHYIAMDNVVNFIDRPHQWLEDAEWSNIDRAY
ncbi:MAG: ferritin family protein [Candidatus Zixiibacteriota bacterium]